MTSFIFIATSLILGVLTPETIIDDVPGDTTLKEFVTASGTGGGSTSTNDINVLISKYNETNLVSRFNAKQDSLNDNQMSVLNSGITSSKVLKYDSYEISKQDTLSEVQIEAIDSGITSAKVTKYDSYDEGKQDRLTSEQIEAINSIDKKRDFYDLTYKAPYVKSTWEVVDEIPFAGCNQVSETKWILSDVGAPDLIIEWFSSESRFKMYPASGRPEGGDPSEITTLDSDQIIFQVSHSKFRRVWKYEPETTIALMTDLDAKAESKQDKLPYNTNSIPYKVIQQPLVGKSFDISGNEGLREAVSNLIQVLGGTIRAM